MPMFLLHHRVIAMRWVTPIGKLVPAQVLRHAMNHILLLGNMGTAPPGLPGDVGVSSIAMMGVCRRSDGRCGTGPPHRRTERGQDADGNDPACSLHALSCSEHGFECSAPVQ